jgi:allantoinase
MPEETERGIIKNVLDTIARSTGHKPRGWLGPALTETDNTLDLLAEAGIDYVADWCNDVQPYAMTTRTGSFVALPLRWNSAISRYSCNTAARARTSSG